MRFKEFVFYIVIFVRLNVHCDEMVDSFHFAYIRKYAGILAYLYLVFPSYLQRRTLSL